MVFCFTHAIFYEELFSKCTDSHVKEYKLYNKLLDKISIEIKLSVLGSLEKDRLTLVSILYILILPFKTIFLLIFFHSFCYNLSLKV